MAITIYGIKNCDTMKKARAWLAERDVPHEFHDYKVSGIDRKRLAGWCAELGWEALLNRTGTTFRKLPDGRKANLDERKAIELMLEQPAMIKRPLLDLGPRRIAGFKPEIYQAAVRKRG